MGGIGGRRNTLARSSRPQMPLIPDLTQHTSHPKILTHVSRYRFLRHEQRPFQAFALAISD